MKDFRNILREHTLRYPCMRPQDYAKLAYQNEFGPKHLMQDLETLHTHIFEEWTACAAASRTVAEPIGNGLCRFHFTEKYHPGEASLLLAQLFIRTMQQHTGSQKGFYEKISLLQNISGMEDWLQSYHAQNCPIIRHSAAYQQAYYPHYRVLQAEYAQYFPVLLAVSKIKKPAVIAIDGRCGSGKTLLAALIQRFFPCNVFHMDDFFLPLHRRTPDWRDKPGANIDFARLRTEALFPARSSNTVRYRRYDCQTDTLLEPVYLSPKPLLIVEGSYSHHPALSGQFDLKIFLTCSRKEQENRLLEREGAYYQTFQTCWIPLEERYFATVSKNGVLEIDTSNFFK